MTLGYGHVDKAGFCDAIGGHEFRGTGACVMCGLKFRCVCGRFMRTDQLKVHIWKCPATAAEETK